MEAFVEDIRSLNPCSDGMASSMMAICRLAIRHEVLILVLMEWLQATFKF